MLKAINWEYYNSHFANISEDEFNKIAYGCERVVLKRLKKPFEEQTPSDKLDIKDCICNVINYQNARKKYDGLSSVSNDGYSVTIDANSKQQYEANQTAIIKEWINNNLLKDEFIAF